MSIRNAFRILMTHVRAFVGSGGQREMTSRHWFLGVLCLWLASLPLACSVTEVLPESLMLEISSEAPVGAA